MLARRRAELEAALKDLDEETRQERARQHQGDLLQRIKDFIGL